MKICFATHNTHKLQEIRQMLGDLHEVVGLEDIGCNVDIPETGDTFKENSLQKAQFIFDNYGIDCFADDSGLEVEALNGAPGIYSARYAGEPSNSLANNQLLLKNLEGQDNRRARFIAVITLILKGEVTQFEGIVSGHIISKFRGPRGFGYDPIFVPEGYNITFAEMSKSEKNTISHRGMAVKTMTSFLKKN